MVYPEGLENSQGDFVKRQLRVRTFFLLSIFGSGVLGFVSVNFLYGWGVNLYVAIVSYLSVLSVIAVILFRFIGFKEGEKMEELDKSSSFSIARFLRVKRVDGPLVMKVRDRVIPVLEHTNGVSFAILRLQFGMNSNIRSENTRAELESAFNIIGTHNLSFSVTVLDEDFEGSDEYTAYLSALRRVTNRKHSVSGGLVAAAVLQEVRDTSCMDDIYLKVCCRYAYQTPNFHHVIASIWDALELEEGAFRSVSCLEKDPLKQFGKSFYGVDLLDFTLSKSIDPDVSLLGVKKRVGVYGIKYKDKTLRSSEVRRKSKAVEVK